MTTTAVKHTHQAIRKLGPYGYTSAVYRHPFTEENRAAHGGVEYREVCSCGYERRVLVNGGHREYGVWDESEAMRKAREERRRRQQERARRIAAFRAMSLAVGHRIGDDIVIASSATPETLADDPDAPVIVRLREDGWRDRKTTIGALYQAARDWQDGPADDPRTAIYTAIGRALP